MEFNDLLRTAGIAPPDVALILHVPVTRDLRRLLIALVDENPDLFEAYQDNHPRNPEATLKSRRFAASFVVDHMSEGRFVGLYAIRGWIERSAAELDADPLRSELMRRFRATSFTERALRTGHPGRAVFDLDRLPLLADMRGRLIVPRPEGRAYVRLAEKCRLSVVSVERDARFVPPPPDWQDFVVTGPEIRTLPQAWQGRLREWRGIYHILDESDGMRYVGAAYGEANILGRWQAHVTGDTGVTKELARRDPARFRFSILDLVAPTAPAEAVIALESSWKLRLDTRTHGLNLN